MVVNSSKPSSTLFDLLMSRAEDLRSHIASRVPTRLQRTISPDDILQDVFITALRNAADLAEFSEADFDPWLMKTAHRRIADSIRRAGADRRGGRSVIIYSKYRKSASFVELFEQICGMNDTPSKVVAQREAISAVQIALAALPQDYRTAITMRYIDGSSYEQMADTLQKSRTAVSSLIHRGLQRMRKLMGPFNRFQSGDGSNLGSTRNPLRAGNAGSKSDRVSKRASPVSSDVAADPSARLRGM